MSISNSVGSFTREMKFPAVNVSVSVLLFSGSDIPQLMQKGERNKKGRERGKRGNTSALLGRPYLCRERGGCLVDQPVEPKVGRDKIFFLFLSDETVCFISWVNHSLANQALVKSQLINLSPKFLVWLSIGTEDNQKVNQELGFPVKQCIKSTMFLFFTSEWF